MKLRTIMVSGRERDLAFAWNEQFAPHVGALKRRAFEELLDKATGALFVEHDGVVAGFLVIFREGADYDSENYRYFDAKYDSFLYVDRIVIAASFQRQGIGRAVYEELERMAREQGAAKIACEVNVKPPNPDSIVFHESLGFREVGRQDTCGGEKRVALLVKDCD
ncbi:MAG: GNAT family N-acetyltransferase [Gemmatimonadetes bacterium]|nr:GNAT family N-acetyltransferase [Gemmatimonadota bacterium]